MALVLASHSELFNSDNEAGQQDFKLKEMKIEEKKFCTF